MEKLKKYIKEKYNLSNYQIAQIVFLFKTILSEVSKILIIGIAFYNRLPLYFFALFILLFLRCSTGGLHFYTYWGCLLTSALYMVLAIYILPIIPVSKYLQLLIVLACILLCNHIGPIISKYRPAECKKQFGKCKNFISIFLFFYAIILYVIPENVFLIAGFWVIILHSLQLFVANFLRKGGS